MENTIIANLTRGIVYRIKCNTTGKCYYGSTVQSLAKRKSVHKMETNLCTSKEIIENNNWTIEEMEEVIFRNKTELLQRERFHIDNDVNAINKNRPIVTLEEKKAQCQKIMRKWYLAHREEHIKKMSLYQDAHHEQHKEHMRNYQYKKRFKK